MKRILFITALFFVLLISKDHIYNLISAKNNETADPKKTVSLVNEGNENNQMDVSKEYKYPEFYKGIYLNITSATNMNLLTKFVKIAKESYINTIVMDVQSSRTSAYAVPDSHVKYCVDNNIHPIARVVVFADGLKTFPVSNKVIESRLEVAEKACMNGFKEIQFDYIRFNDSEKNRHVTLNERYNYIEGFLLKARKRLQKYNVKIAADIFGRIPLNNSDIIGQRMEGLDNVVDIICPMAYPSHYTWNKKYYADPYYTVYTTSANAKKRTKKAEIVSYIQGFQMKLSGIPFTKYIRDQLAAVHDSGIKGFLFWNAQQIYDIPLSVTKSFYIQKQEANKVAKDKI